MKFNKTKIFLFAFLGILVVFSCFLFFTKGVGAEDWLAGGWAYRKQITINGSSGAGTNYQVKLKVGESNGASGYDFHIEGHAANFPNDIRFTDNDNLTELSHWLEKTEGVSPNQTAYFWVKVQDNLDVNQDIYIYYGNPSASSASNGENTFEFFDDFDDNSIDSAKWSTHTKQYAAIAETGNEIEYSFSNNSAQNGGNLYTKKTFNKSDAIIITASVRKQSTVSNWGYGMQLHMFNLGQLSWTGTHYDDPVPNTVIGLSPGRNQPLDARVKITLHGNGNYSRELISGTWGGGGCDVSNQPISGWADMNEPFVFDFQGWDYHTHSCYLDDINIRKYASSEPSFGSIGSEEEPTTTETCSHHNVYSWAWSENIGWVSFSCENETPLGTGINYGVDIDDVTGEFSGYAWSRGTDDDVGGVGWIDFAPVGPYPVCPTCPDYSACINLPNISGEVCEADLSEGQVGGWARVVSSGEWIKLRGTAQDSTDYGVYITGATGEFHGWAYGEGSVGWISFNCAEGGESGGNICPQSDYKVETTLSFITAPNKPFNLSVPLGESAYCWSSSGYCGKVIPRFTWDSETGQTGYEIWIDKGDSFVSEPVEFKHEADYAGPTDPPHSFVLSPVWGYELEFGETYYWKVRTKNNGDNWSEWSDVGSFATDSHAWPCVDFVPNPLSPAIDQVVHFIQDGASPYEAYESICYPGGVGQGCEGISAAYSWDFGNGKFSTEKDNTTTTYNVSGVFYTIRLEITHDLKTCSCERDVSVGLPFPKWKEIKPH